MEKERNGADYYLALAQYSANDDPIQYASVLMMQVLHYEGAVRPSRDLTTRNGPANRKIKFGP